MVPLDRNPGIITCPLGRVSTPAGQLGGVAAVLSPWNFPPAVSAGMTTAAPVTGTKAGGADYLLHFVEPRTSTENTLRHGFAPGLDG